jgi:hypothetical protein
MAFTSTKSCETCGVRDEERKTDDKTKGENESRMKIIKATQPFALFLHSLFMFVFILSNSAQAAEQKKETDTKAQ